MPLSPRVAANVAAVATAARPVTVRLLLRRAHGERESHPTLERWYGSVQEGRRPDAGRSDVVTKRGRPAAVLLPVEEAEDLLLANADEYVRQRRQARADYEGRRTRRLEDLD